MAEKTEIQSRLTFWKSALSKLQTAYIALVDGGVKSYTIDDRTLTHLDLPSLEKRIQEAESKVDQYTALLNGGKPRRAFAIVPEDW